MNKRQEPVSARVSKKNSKEVHEGMGKKDTPAPVRAKKSILIASILRKEKTPKKHSKRTSPKEKIENSAPAHVHTENEHWGNSIRKQIDVKTKRLTKRLSKKH